MASAGQLSQAVARDGSSYWDYHGKSQEFRLFTGVGVPRTVVQHVRPSEVIEYDKDAVPGRDGEVAYRRRREGRSRRPLLAVKDPHVRDNRSAPRS